MQLQPNKLLQGGKYRIEATLGQGGFGITYLAEQNIMLEGGLGKIATTVKVTIKELYLKEHCNRDHDTSYVSVPSVGSQVLVDKCRRKFIKEAQNISRLDHNNIIKVLDVFEENGTAYYVMEYINGGSLGDRITKNGAISEYKALHYVRQIANALQYIHSHKITHLDVKPDNILIKKGNVAVLIDFGLANQYDENGNQLSSILAAASRGYAPLEQYENDSMTRFSPTTDIYSLGATLYKLVTGDTPPHATSVNNFGLPELPDTLSPAVKCAIATAMQPRIMDRPQDIGAFLDLLGDSAEAEETMAISTEEETTHTINNKPVETPAPTPTPAPKPAEQHIAETGTPNKKRKYVGIIAAVAIAIILFGGGMLFLSRDKDKATNETTTSKQDDIITKNINGNFGEATPLAQSTKNNVKAEVVQKLEKKAAKELEKVTITEVTKAKEIPTPEVTETPILEEVKPQYSGPFTANTYKNMGSPRSLEIPYGYTSIGDGAFDNCDDLISISIPSSVTSIGKEAFRVCDGITSISIPNSVAYVGEDAFYWCDVLTSIYVSPSSRVYAQLKAEYGDIVIAK